MPLPPRRHHALWMALLVGMAAHVVLVRSIAIQPLDVNARPGQRSIVWPLYNDSAHRIGPAADFFAVYHAGVQMSRDGNPYEGQEDPVVTPYFFSFRYLPAVGTTFGKILTLLSPQRAYWVWVGILELLLGGVLLCLWRARVPARLALFATGVLLASSPFFLEVHMGQFTFASLALLFFSLLLFDHPKPSVARTAGGTIAFATTVLLKVFPLAAAPAFLHRRSGWVALLVATGFVLVLNLPWFLQHPQEWRSFVGLNLAQDMSGLDSGNHGLLRLVHMISHELGVAWTPEAWRILVSVWRLILLGGTALLVASSRHPSRILIGGAALMLAHFLSYVHVWEHHMSGALVMGAALLVGLTRRSAATTEITESRPVGARPALLLLCGALVLLALPTPFALFDTARAAHVWDPTLDWPLPVRLLMTACKVVPVATMFVVAVVALARGGLVLPWRGSRAV